MKVLVLLPDSPDPWDNTAARYYGPMLRGLAARGCEVQAICMRGRRFTGPEGTDYFAGSGVRFAVFDPPAPRRLLERKLRSLVRPGWELSVSPFGEAARRAAESPWDTIFAETPATSRCVERDPRTVLSLDHLSYLDLAPLGEEDPAELRKQRLQFRRAELSGCREVRRLRTVSSRLDTACGAAGVRTPRRVVPICIDPALYAPVDPPAVPTVGVLGSMFWPPSRRAARGFLERIAPRLRARIPGVRFVVGGWRARELIGQYVRAADIELLDSFPDPRAAFERLSVLFYAPPVGTGMKVKVLEAMAYGVPVVVNEEGFEGLDADPEPPFSPGRSDEELSEAVVALLNDPARWRAAVAGGRACLARSFSPDPVCDRLLEVLSEAAW